MREMSCPLKKSWKLRWRRARRVVAHFGRRAAFAAASSAVAEFVSSVTRSLVVGRWSLVVSHSSLATLHRTFSHLYDDGNRRKAPEPKPGNRSVRCRCNKLHILGPDFHSLATTWNFPAGSIRARVGVSRST